jgi:hypothetical protein
MNRKIIQKLIDELDKESPRLDYIRGILETILEGLPSEPITNIDRAINKIVADNKIEDEGTLLEREAQARLKNIKIQYDN